MPITTEHPYRPWKRQQTKLRKEIKAIQGEILGIYAKAQKRLTQLVQWASTGPKSRRRSRSLSAQVKREVEVLNGTIPQWLIMGDKNTRYGVGMTYQNLSTPSLPLPTPDFDTVMRTDSISILAEQIEDDVKFMNDSIGRQARRSIRVTQQTIIPNADVSRVVAQGFAEGRSVEGIARGLEAKFRENTANGQFVTIKCRDGVTRHYRIDKYAKLVARTQSREAQTLGNIAEAQDVGADLVQIDVHDWACPICKKRIGKVYSISGDSEVFPPLQDMPPYHPNCMCNLVGVWEAQLEYDGVYEALIQYSNNPENTVEGWDGYQARLKSLQREIEGKAK